MLFVRHHTIFESRLLGRLRYGPARSNDINSGNTHHRQSLFLVDAESFDRNVRPLGIERGRQPLWKDGGVLYAPDLR